MTITSIVPEVAWRSKQAAIRAMNINRPVCWDYFLLVSLSSPILSSPKCVYDTFKSSFQYTFAFSGLPVSSTGPLATNFEKALHHNRALMAWVDQHKIHNSFKITSRVAKNTEEDMAAVEARKVSCFGSMGINNNQKE